MEKQNVKRISGFHVTRVFDVSQTDGKELPKFASVTGDPGKSLSNLENLISENKIELTYDFPPSGALGISSGGKIMIRPDLPPAEKFSVAVHELAHEMLHQGGRRHDTTKTVRETEAEAVAFIVCRAMGLDCSTHSSDYIALYRGSSDTLSESLQFIQKTATKIIRELTKP